MMWKGKEGIVLVLLLLIGATVWISGSGDEEKPEAVEAFSRSAIRKNADAPGESSMEKPPAKKADAGDRIQNQGRPALHEAEAAHEDAYDEVITRITNFEAGVLDETGAVNVRLETPSLVAWAEGKQATNSLEEACSAQGYVAFSGASEAFSDGIYHTMADISGHYFKNFPKAPSVKVSLVIGNVVHDQEIFYNENITK